MNRAHEQLTTDPPVSAEVAGWMCGCGHQVQFQDGIAICNDCGKQYRRTGEEIKRFKKPLP